MWTTWIASERPFMDVATLVNDTREDGWRLDDEGIGALSGRTWQVYSLGNRSYRFYQGDAQAREVVWEP